MFGKIRSLFAEEKSKSLNYREARSFFFEQTKGMVERTFNECSEQTRLLQNELKGLKKLFLTLQNSEIEEKRAKGSVGVKDRYAEKALTMIDTLDTAVNNFSMINSFVINTKNSMQNINSMTPKQAMHLKFFFENEMAEIARKTEEINRIVEELDARLNEGVLKKRNEIQEIFNEIDNLEKRVSLGESQLEKIPEDVETTKRQLTELRYRYKAMDISGLDSEQKRMAILKDRRNEIEQKIFSEFGALERLLRKYQYKQKDEIVSGFIEGYINNPKEAFLRDGNNEMAKILKHAIELAKNGEIDIDDKKIDLADSLVKRFSELVQLRKEIYEIDREIKERILMIESDWIPKKQVKDELSARITDLEKEIEKKETEKAHLILDKKSAEKKIVEQKHKLTEKMAEMLNISIQIRKENDQ